MLMVMLINNNSTKCRRSTEELVGSADHGVPDDKSGKSSNPISTIKSGLLCDKLFTLK